MAFCSPPTYNERLANVERLIGAIPNFPKPGIIFRDIFPVLRDPQAFADLVVIVNDHVKATGPFDAVLGLDARGFIFAPIVALHLGVPFVPVRKKGKLPGDVVQASYQLEYGHDTFEAQKGSLASGQRVLIVDDLIATGGSLQAACQLVKEMGAEVKECLVIIELEDLQGRKNLPPDCNFHSLVKFREK